MLPLESRMEEKLEKRKQEMIYRKLPLSASGGGLDFSSNDYLGLARNSQLSEKVLKNSGAVLMTNGSTGSRLLSGNSPLAEQLEEELARFFNSEASLLFNSGYTANLGLLSSLPQKGDTILYDELAHASLKDGARLSLAQRFSFQHNSFDSLRKYLNRAQGQAFVVVESVYSMDGDMAPLQEIAALCKASGAALIVDEAHSTGIYGRGSGLVCELGLEEEIFARVHTFGKAVGCHGACIAGSQRLKDFLVNFARSFIYTTAMPPHTLLTLQAAFHYIHEHPELPGLLQDKISKYKELKEQFLKGMLPEELQIESNSPVQAIVLPGNGAVRDLADAVKREGYDIKAVLAPTVPRGKERIRICLHVYNTEAEIEGLIKAIAHSLS